VRKRRPHSRARTKSRRAPLKTALRGRLLTAVEDCLPRLMFPGSELSAHGAIGRQYIPRQRRAFECRDYKRLWKASSKKFQGKPVDGACVLNPFAAISQSLVVGRRVEIEQDGLFRGRRFDDRVPL
jgi:hypothetical protein